MLHCLLQYNVHCSTALVLKAAGSELLEVLCCWWRCCCSCSGICPEHHRHDGHNWNVAAAAATAVRRTGSNMGHAVCFSMCCMLLWASNRVACACWVGHTLSTMHLAEGSCCWCCSRHICCHNGCGVVCCVRMGVRFGFVWLHAA
jgi:hypothetical protein